MKKNQIIKESFDAFADMNSNPIEFMREKKYTLKDFNFSPRVANHWIEKGIIANDHEAGKKIKLSLAEAFWLKLVDQLRLFNVSLESIKRIKSDFFDSERHTEPSIQRARKIYPPQSDVVLINTEKIDFESDMFDSILLFFAAHEVRNEQERIAFFKELNRILKPEGKIYITEHLRDWVNFIPYSVGFFHFYSKNNWSKIVHSSDLKIEKEIKTTSFVSTFILTKNGN